jgi:hypothetical protein
MVGAEEFARDLDGVARKVEREGQAHILRAARKCLVPEMRSRALRSPGKSGALLARFTTARLGRGGAVVVGPRSGAKRAWYRAFFVSGSKPHEIGKPEAGRAETFRTYLSSAKQYAAAGGVFTRRIKAREATPRKFLTNAARYLSRGGDPFQATGPVRSPGIPSNPFVERGAEAGAQAMGDELAKTLYAPGGSK